jgi:hypothetical protein
MIALLKSIRPYLISGVVALGAIVFGFLKSKQAQTTVAQAGQKVAEAQVDAARAQTQVAEARDATAQANATAAQAGAQAIKERRDVENDTAGQSDNDVRNELRAWASPGRGAGRNAASDSADPDS